MDNKINIGNSMIFSLSQTTWYNWKVTKNLNILVEMTHHKTANCCVLNVIVSDVWQVETLRRFR